MTNEEAMKAINNKTPVKMIGDDRMIGIITCMDDNKTVAYVKWLSGFPVSYSTLFRSAILPENLE